MVTLNRLLGKRTMSEEKKDGKATGGRRRAIPKLAPILGMLAFVLLLSSVTSPSAGHAAFPGANGEIVFLSNRDGNLEVYVMNADGTGQTRLTNTSATELFPRWSPDGTKIVFRSTRDGNPQIYVMNADGTGQTRLTNNLALDDQPTWSPDGSKIAFVRDQPGPGLDLEVYVMNAYGSGQTNLTNNPVGSHDDRPAWSPDGTKIAFNSNRDGNPQIYVMNTDGSGQTRLTFYSAVDTHSTWSPDGSKIAFRSTRDGNSEIYVMNTDGSGQTRLTNNLASDDQPAWSPDGTKIAFDTDRDGNQEIYVMDADGSNPTNLTNNGAAADVHPDWQPLNVVMTVEIDIKPGSDPNCFNNDGNGVIPVAILGSVDFDVTTIDASTVMLEGLEVKAVGKSDKLLAHIEDVNSDGFDDLVVQIQDSDGAFVSGSGTATLTGNLFDGTPIEGTDSICVVP